MDMPYVGPFRVEEILERDRYRVVGRQGAKHLHHEFHISRLKLWPAGADAEDVYLDGSYYDVERIVGSRRNKKGAWEFRVRWQGYAAKHDTWERAGELPDNLKLEFWRDLQQRDQEGTRKMSDAERRACERLKLKF